MLHVNVFKYMKRTTNKVLDIIIIIYLKNQCVKNLAQVT